MKKAIILAAGRGSRIGRGTDTYPKPMTNVAGCSIIENTLKLLQEEKITHVYIVIGYLDEIIRKHIESLNLSIVISFIHNEHWHNKNNIYSLYIALKQFLHDVKDGAILLLEGDIYFDESALSFLHEIKPEENIALVSQLNKSMEGTFVKINQGEIISFDSTKKYSNFFLTESTNEKYKTVNIYCLSYNFCKDFIYPEIKSALDHGFVDGYYESIFPNALENGYNIKAHYISVDSWYEIDNLYDLNSANFIFSSDKSAHIDNKYGGYWRYKIQDHSLIYNFHFPPFILKEKIIDRFDDILLNYPCSSNELVPYISDFFGVPDDSILLFNGISEVIRILPYVFKNDVILVEPSFNEYARVYNGSSIHFFSLSPVDGFKLDIDSLIDLSIKSKAKLIVLTSPNNPTGKPIERDDIIKIYNATTHLCTSIIIDESFMDFSSKKADLSFLQIAQFFPRVIIFKSMSKTFGIGGVRLGIVISYNDFLISQFNKHIPIWNINGFAEEIIMNLPQYKNEYLHSCLTVRTETDYLIDELKTFRSLKVFDSDSNFVLCKVLSHEINAEGLFETLLNKYNILIKLCKGKGFPDSSNYVRISSRTQGDNEKLISCLRDIFHD